MLKQIIVASQAVFFVSVSDPKTMRTTPKILTSNVGSHVPVTGGVLEAVGVGLRLALIDAVGEGE